MNGKTSHGLEELLLLGRQQSPNWIYRFCGVHQHPLGYFAGSDKLILKFMKTQEPSTAKIIYKKQQEDSFPDLKASYKATVCRTQWCWHNIDAQPSGGQRLWAVNFHKQDQVPTALDYGGETSTGDPEEPGEGHTLIKAWSSTLSANGSQT